MRSVCVLAATALLAVVATAPVAATHDPRHGDVCSGPGEPSFVCGEVHVQMHVGVDIQPVLKACPPVGAVIEARDGDYRIAVQVGSEIALRDCYGAQPGVGHADLGYFGAVEPDSAMAPSHPAARTVLGFFLLITGVIAGATFAVRQRRSR